MSSIDIMDLSYEKTNRLLGSIPHLFLPKRTPEAEQSNLQQIEQFILETVTQSVSEAVEKSSITELNALIKALETWELLQLNMQEESENFKKAFIQSINDLEISTVPIYVRKQNATVIFEKDIDSGTIFLKTFRSSLPTKIVMGNVHELRMNFPETSNTVQNINFLHSEKCAEILYELSTEDFGLSTPQISRHLQSFDDVRNAAEPFLVNDFLVRLLCPDKSLEVNRTLQPVYKKIRDQITLKAVDHSSSLQPFRRTGLWMSLKVAIQLKLQKLLKNEQLSKLVYKILMHQVISNICKMYYNSRNKHQLDFDLMAQMLIKLERRTEKVEKIFSELNKILIEDNLASIEEKIQSLKDSTLDSVFKILKEINQFMTDKISSLDSINKIALATRTTDEYLNDLSHEIPGLSKIQKELKVLDGITNSRDDPNLSSDLLESLEILRFPNSNSVINGANSFSSMTQSQQQIWLHDTENFLKTKLPSEPDSGKILKIVCNYVKIAVGIYKGENPLGGSQLILSVLKATEELDKRARKLHPLLNQYKTGIEDFTRLVLPHKDDIILLEEALDYFQEIDLEVPDYLKDCSILTENITPNSFSVRFAEENEEMMRMLNKVRAHVEVNISQKLEEFHRVKKECEEINEKMTAEGDCSCEYQTLNLWSRKWKKFYTRRNKIRTCLHCIYLKQLQAKVTSVSVYERPLPIQDHLQKAVMFELFIPQEISHLRDALQILHGRLIKTSEFFLLKSSGQITTEWEQFDKLRSYLDRSPTNDFSLVKFGSKHLPYSRTGYSKSNPNLLYATEDSIVCKCWLDCLYSFKFSADRELSRFTLSFELEHTDNPEPYEALQLQLSSWKHSQNSVLCSQYACSKKLSVEEFVTFGSIRAGHRIQLRNLYRAISSNSLSLSEEPVLALILQTIWQLGPRNSNGNWESHEDFAVNPSFCQEFLTLLRNLIKENESNYTHPYILLCAIAITVRIMELSSNGEVSKRGNELLREWRKLIRKWTLKVEGEIQKGRGSFSSQIDLEGLEKTLLVVRICSAFSYNFSPSKYWTSVFATENDLAEWFHTVYYLNQKGSIKFSDLSFIQILLNQAKRLAYQLNLESEASHPFIALALRKFTAEKWEKALEYSREPTLQNKTRNNLLELNFMKGTDSQVDSVTFDLLLGRFLVNGFPAKFLPAGVASHEQFIRYFGETNAKLAVQPETVNLFHTIDRFHGSQFEFRSNINGNDLKITETTKDKERRVLLRPELFEGYLQPFFIKNFTHWLSLQENVVYFKRICKDDTDFDLKPEYKLIKENSRWKLFDENNQGYLLSIQSQGFLSLAGFLSKLELLKHINVLMTEKNEIIVYLPRQTLRFKLDTDNNTLESVEYSGYVVKDDEPLKTLAGLQQGILLRKGEKRILLIPHGNVHLERRPYHHKTVIALEKLHSPRYFVYEVDKVLKRLKGNLNKLSYLYLAYLHALTSLTSSLPDDFTEITGTEMALRILQSGFMWSSSPYDKHCKKYLHLIQELSPKRSCYGHRFSSWGGNDNAEEIMAGVEMIEWPENLPTMSACDGFHLIVHKLTNDSEKLAVLHKQEETEDNNSLSVRIQLSDKLARLANKSGDKLAPRFLRYRAYLNCLNLYNNLAKLELDIIPSKYLNLTKNEIVLDSKQSESCNVGALRIAAYLQNSDKLMKCSMFNPTSFVPFLLQPHKPLNEFLPSWYSTFKEMLSFDFRGSWFQLYKMASKADKTFEEKESFILLLSTLAYRQTPFKEVLIFHYLNNFFDFEFPEVPNPLPSPKRNVPAENPDNDTLQTVFETILKRNKIPQPRKYCPTEEEKEEIEKVKLIVENALEDAKIFFAEEFLKNADTSTGLHRLFTKDDLKSLPVEYFQSDSILVEINTTVETLNTDKMLRNFCAKLETELKKKYGELPEADQQINKVKAIESAKEVNTVVKINIKDVGISGSVRFNFSNSQQFIALRTLGYSLIAK